MLMIFLFNTLNSFFFITSIVEFTENKNKGLNFLFSIKINLFKNYYKIFGSK